MIDFKKQQKTYILSVLLRNYSTPQLSILFISISFILPLFHGGYICLTVLKWGLIIVCKLGRCYWIIFGWNSKLVFNLCYWPVSVHTIPLYREGQGNGGWRKHSRSPILHLTGHFSYGRKQAWQVVLKTYLLNVLHKVLL